MSDIDFNKEDPIDAVEQEDLGETVITRPYDPDKIRVDHQNINLGGLIEMLEFNEIDLMPDFQRESDLWNDTKKSQLIESILLGLPLPSFYFSVDKNTNKWLVVDGLQRLSTLKLFCVEKKLKLIGLEFLHSYLGKSYDNLSRADHRKISGFKINQYVIDKETPPEVKFLIFKRVNTGGLILTPQEMRHALNQGVPAEFIKRLSTLDEFKLATDFKISSKRQQDRDFVNRFVAFHLLGYEDNYEGELDKFLNDGMSKINELNENELAQLEVNFIGSMFTCFLIFGNDSFRKRYDTNANRKPISKAVFDTISVNISWVSSSEWEELINKKDQFKARLIDLFNNDAFNSAVSTGTGQKSKVKYRFEKIKDLIWKILHHD